MSPQTIIADRCRRRGVHLPGLAYTTREKVVDCLTAAA
jgi:hypothetical protein